MSIMNNTAVVLHDLWPFPSLPTQSCWNEIKTLLANKYPAMFGRDAGKCNVNIFLIKSLYCIMHVVLIPHVTSS